MNGCGTSEQVTVLAVGGTGESAADDRRTEVTGLLAQVTAELDNRFRPVWVGYPASYGPAPHLRGMSYADSVDEGVARLGRAIAATTGTVVLIGYSQGAVVVRRLLADLAADPSQSAALARVAAAGFVADPHQPPGAVPGCSGWGVAGAGPRLPRGLAAHWVGAPEDMICNATRDSLIRDIADLTGAMTLAAPVTWASSMWQTVCTNAFQNAARTRNGPAQWRRDLDRLVAAWTEVRHYLPERLAWRGLDLPNPLGGRHVCYDHEPYHPASWTDPDATGCQKLAHWLQVQVTFANTVRSSNPVVAAAA
ncbi:MAG: PE-PPE domain-containing protein [Gordonia sp. (in: high G+C Gram-positive bacteria)]